MKIILFSAGLLSVFTACASKKEFVKPDLNIPENYRNEISVTGDSIILPYKSFFKDQKLVGLIEKALEKNNEVATALKNIEQLDLAYKQAKNTLMPTVDFGASASRSWASQNSLNGSLNEQFTGNKYLDDFSATLKLSWEVDVWGKAKKQKESAAAEYFAQKENFLALKSRIVVQVAQAYYNLISLDEQLKIANQNIELSNETLRIMNLQFTAGQINSLAIHQSEAQKKTAEIIVPLAKQNIAVQENALSILCGEYPSAVERSGEINHILSENPLTASVPAQLLSRRPDLKAAEFNLISLNAKTGLAKVAMYPSLSLTPQAGLNSFKVSTWFDIPGSITKTLAANLAMPLLNKRSLKTAYETAVIEQEKAAITYKQTMLTAVGEVSDAMAKSYGTSERMKLLNERTEILNKGINDALKLYKNGMATYLEVITAQNNKLQNDLEQINVILEKANAEVDLYRALGGGIE